MRILFTKLFILFLPANALSQVYIDRNGSDDNDGTKNHPFQSFTMALRKAREMRRLNDPLIKNGIEIIVGDGYYKLSEPILIRPEDAGTSESPTIIRAEEGAHPVLMSGFAIGGWKKASAAVPINNQRTSLSKIISMGFAAATMNKENTRLIAIVIKTRAPSVCRSPERSPASASTRAPAEDMPSSKNRLVTTIMLRQNANRPISPGSIHLPRMMLARNPANIDAV